MSYKISVPIINGNVERMGREALAQSLRELDAKRVMLALDRYETDPEKRKAAIATLKENCEYFHEQGFEVCAWIWTFWINGEHPYTEQSMVSEGENITSGFACPLDSDFRRFAGDYIADIARCGVDMIMFDDDFRYGFHSGGNMGCICELHRKRICEDVGENISRADLAKRIKSGGRNKYRDAWIKENGYSLELFAKNAREYVDTVDPSIRLGVCACLSSWDLDGTDVYTLSKILAGNTRPFARLTGAPYWASGNPSAWNNYLQDVIELERMEKAWIGDADIELMAEGDAFPRPRIKCPASFMEGFDTAIRASGCTDGNLKYGIDYTSSPKYERGYIEYHKRNRELYKIIDDSFGEKIPCGIRIYEFPQKVADMDLTAKKDPQKSVQYSFFSAAARLLGGQAIPTVYEGRGVCGIAFGENARYLDKDARGGGLIIDGIAAKILHSNGIDVGIEALGKRTPVGTEYFNEYDEYISDYSAKANDHKFNKNIKILSVATDSNIPVSYCYENGDGERYLVINVDIGDCAELCDVGFIRHYMRGRQIADKVEWLSRGNRLPAYSYGNPCVYLMAKKDDTGMTVGLWNFFADTAMGVEVELGDAYESLSCRFGCKGELKDGKISLSDIPPYGFACVELKK